ncbi:hypothetical protein HDU93_006185, partial [Gonapodya sp. JEL0774]
MEVAQFLQEEAKYHEEMRKHEELLRMVEFDDFDHNQDLEQNGVRVPRLSSDPQNVHDPAVISGIKGSWNRIKDTLPGKVDQRLTVIRDTVAKEIRERLSNDKQANALMTLDDIVNKKNEYITFANADESTILSSTWAIVEQSGELRENLVDILVDRLSDGVENGRVVCAQGRASRVIDTFSGVADVTAPLSIQPAGSLREEILSKASVLRRESYNALSDSDRV